MKQLYTTVNNYPVFVSERRRYGNRTFTYLIVQIGNAQYSLGDPWPCVRPKRDEVSRAVQAVLDYIREEGQPT